MLGGFINLATLSKRCHAETHKEVLAMLEKQGKNAQGERTMPEIAIDVGLRQVFEEYAHDVGERRCVLAVYYRQRSENRFDIFTVTRNARKSDTKAIHDAQVEVARRFGGYSMNFRYLGADKPAPAGYDTVYDVSRMAREGDLAKMMNRTLIQTRQIVKNLNIAHAKSESTKPSKGLGYAGQSAGRSPQQPRE